MNKPQGTVVFKGIETGVTISLNANWHQESKGDPIYPTEVYYVTRGGEFAPTITIRKIDLPPDEYHRDNYLQLSQILLDEQSSQNESSPPHVLEQHIVQVDDHPCRIDIFEWVEKDTGIPIIQFQATIQLSSSVCGFVAILKKEDQSTYLPTITDAAFSLKFDETPQAIQSNN